MTLQITNHVEDKQHLLKHLVSDIRLTTTLWISQSHSHLFSLQTEMIKLQSKMSRTCRIGVYNAYSQNVKKKQIRKSQSNGSVTREKKSNTTSTVMILQHNYCSVGMQDCFTEKVNHAENYSPCEAI